MAIFTHGDSLSSCCRCPQSAGIGSVHVIFTVHGHLYSFPVHVLLDETSIYTPVSENAAPPVPQPSSSKLAQVVQQSKISGPMTPTVWSDMDASFSAQYACWSSLGSPVEDWDLRLSFAQVLLGAISSLVFRRPWFQRLAESNFLPRRRLCLGLRHQWGLILLWEVDLLLELIPGLAFLSNAGL